MAKQIPVNGGDYFATVDDADFDLVKGHTWHYRNGYAGTNIPTGRRIKCRGRKNGMPEYRGVLMHRLITGAADDQVVDHINHDGMDNQRSNMRVCSHKENTWNQRPAKRNSSGFKGVTWRERDHLWRATICINGNQIDVGMSKDPVVCAKKYDIAAKKYYGEFAYLNFPEEK